MTKVELQQWHPCEICGAQTAYTYCSVCVRKTPPPLLEAYTTPGTYAVCLRTGNYLSFTKARPFGKFAMLVLADGTEAFVRVRDVIWSIKQ